MTAPGPADTAADRRRHYRERGWWRDETFLDDLRRQARTRPRKTAVAARRVRQARTDQLDYADLARLTDRFAAGLLELGVQRGEVVLVQTPNRWEIAPLMFACAAVGAVFCPIAPECREDELRHRLAATGAKVCVTVPEWGGYPLAEVLCGLRVALPLDHVAVLDGRAPKQGIDFHRHFVARDDRPDLEGRALGPDDPFVVLFTSGTTGFPKGVVHTQNTVHSGIRGYADALALDDSVVIASTTPLVHYSGFAQGVLASVMLGGTVAFQDEPDHAGLLGLVERHRATLLYGPPLTLSGVAAAQRVEPHDLSSLRRAVAGASPVVAELVEELRDALGVSTQSLWGMSEFGPITISPLDYDRDRAARSHGRPVEAMELRIEPAPELDRDPAVGRLSVRGASQAVGYLGRQEEFEAAISADGWFDTGDLARDDGRGGIRVLGRAKDAIRCEGALAPTAELEATIAVHPKVTEAAVVGCPGSVREGILAVVTPRGGAGPTLEEIRSHLRDRGHDHRFLPDRLETVEALPKTITGKVRKAEIRRRYAA